MQYKNTKMILMFSFFFFSYGMITLYNEMGFVIIPVVSIFLYLPLVLKLFFFENLNFDYKGLKTTHRLNEVLNIISEIFLIVFAAILAFTAIVTYDVKNKENVANMFPYAVISIAVVTYFIASGIKNKWMVLVGPLIGSVLVMIYFGALHALKLV